MAAAKQQKQVANPYAYLDEPVTVYVPRAQAGEEQQLYLSVNGNSMYVPRGRNVQLPRYAAEVLMQTLRLEEKYERDVAETYRNPSNAIPMG